jgi:DNA-binding transcriptional MerR regulator
VSWKFTQWYEQNAPSFNAKRRSRYETDPEYRAKVLEMNRKNREKRQAERAKEDKARKKAVKVVASPAWKEFEGEAAGGETSNYVTIGAVAKAIRRSTQSVRLWEKQGLIPETPYRNQRGDRLYTPQMVLEILNKVKDIKDLDPVDNKASINPVDAEVKLANGTLVEMRLFRVGVLAQAVGRTVLTLEQMERKGVFPSTPFRDPNTGHRYYSAEMIEAVKNAVDEMGGSRLRGDQRKAEFNNRITNDWTALGVIGASMIQTKKGTTDGEEV